MMRSATRWCVLMAVAGVLCTPGWARADAYVNPWAGVHFGNDSARSGVRSFGVAIGEAGNGMIGVETNIGFAPGFFGSGVDNYEIDFMAGLRFGPTINPTGNVSRPYVIGEVGMIRTSINSAVIGGRFARTDFGFAAGFGITHDLTERMAFRADLRYLRSLNGDGGSNSLGIEVGSFHFWRFAFGVALH